MVENHETLRSIQKEIDAPCNQLGLGPSVDIRRFGRPDEIGKLACFLASEDSSFITGASYVIDGGTLAWRGAHS